MRRLLATAVSLAALALLAPLAAAPAATAQDGDLRAGAGQADITPPRLGYFLGGWTRADRLARGQSTRLFSNALVLERGDTKLALVAAELFAIPAGLQEDVARAVADLGYDRSTVLLAASHTHSGPGGFANNPTYNTAAPSLETVEDPWSFIRLLVPPRADRQLYTFLVRQIAASIRRADGDMAPAAAAWGQARLSGLTQNRSIEAHLADHGLEVPFGEGSAEQDPDGPAHAIDPQVDVLRVDKLGGGGPAGAAGASGGGPAAGGGGVPIGAWSSFANHGTVVHSELQAYSGDHHAAAWRRFAEAVRAEGAVPEAQTVVNVYPNADEGDQTAGIANVGPAAAQRIGEAEAGAMLEAWRDAGTRLERRPALGVRWTRACFCGRQTANGPVAARGVPGLGFLTGSEEGRGPLYDITRTPLEGVTARRDDPVQGDKVQIPLGDFQPAVPFAVARIGSHALAAVPGEATKEVGVRIRAAVLRELAPAGVTQVAIAGLALDYIQYITTREEYGRQSYEGASTLFGRNEGQFVVERLAELAQALASGAPAAAPDPFDPSYGVRPDGRPYPAGAARGTLTAQPAPAVERLDRAGLAWDGGPSGRDRPVDRPFVTAERRTAGGWRAFADDLGLQFLWRSDADGHATAQWEVPLDAPAGSYRLVVTGSRYRLASRAFRVVPSTRLTVRPAAGGGARIEYPAARAGVDLTDRPAAADGGSIRLAGRVVEQASGTAFPVPAGARIAAGAARDRYGNRNAEAVTLPR